MARKHNLVSILETIFNLGIRLLIRVIAKNNILEEFYFFWHQQKFGAINHVKHTFNSGSLCRSLVQNLKHLKHFDHGAVLFEN